MSNFSVVLSSNDGKCISDEEYLCIHFASHCTVNLTCILRYFQFVKSAVAEICIMLLNCPQQFDRLSANSKARHCQKFTIEILSTETSLQGKMQKLLVSDWIRNIAPTAGKQCIK